MRAVVYARVSTDAQERDGTSLDTQQRACLDFVRSQGWAVVDTVRDTASGFSLDRPGIERVRHAIRHGEVDVLVAYAVDRLSRNQNQIGVLFDECEQRGVRLEFVTEKFEDTAMGRFILAARAFIAEIEREKIAERTMRGKLERARSGRLPQGTGKGIYGYTYSRQTGTRALHDLQAPVVQRIFDQFLGGWGVSRIAYQLNRDHIPAFAGGAWYPLTVRRILMNETYTGHTIYRRVHVELSRDPVTGKKRRKLVERDEGEWIEVPDVSPPIIDGTTFMRAKALLEAPGRRERGRPTETYRLRGRLRCWSCNTPMTGQTLGRGRWRYYRCRNSYTNAVSQKCDERYVPRDLLERAVFDEIIDVLTDPVRLRDEVERTLDPRPIQMAVVDATKALARIEEQQKRLTRLFVSGELPENLLKAEARRLQAERDQLEQQLKRQSGHGSAELAATMLSRIPDIAAHIAQWVRHADGDDLDLLLRALDIHIKACRERAMIEASIPVFESVQDLDLVTIEQTSA